MRDRLACEFFLIRYVPDVVKGEFTNIGVVLREARGAVGEGVRLRPELSPDARALDSRAIGTQAIVRFTRDWSRVRCMDADADIGLLEALEGEIAARLQVSDLDWKPVMGVLEDTLSNSVQITEARACLAESMPAEIDQLMKMYVEPLKVKTERKRTGRAAIAGAMRTEFERAAVWGLMRKRIAASAYTRPGDPMKIDCGYRAVAAEGGLGGIVRMFHAVSLDGDVEAAKGLSYSAPQLRDGVARVEGVPLELTAVVEALRGVAGEDLEDEATERYRFGVEAMERQAIRVVTVNDLARAAQTARLELRL